MSRFNFRVDTAKKVIELTYHVAPIVLKGKYKAGGMLLILPISGDGDVTIKISKYTAFSLSLLHLKIVNVGSVMRIYSLKMINGPIQRLGRYQYLNV